MILYHGSNVQIVVPDLSKGRNPLDFGRGFYLTSSQEQATNWAKRKTERLQEGIACLNIYEFNQALIGDLSVKIFEQADESWLDFIVQNRNETYLGESYDIVIGPVADDGVLRLIRLYMEEFYDKDETIRRFKTERLDDQYVFCTQKALNCLTFKGAIIL
ncbi:DUF3990 domain-containing protein [Neisseria yangbaofengii]|uniref:DUF3990 domain-containing protein n=1 Tax=Neisseria yangbaofengii TaxID=2709396 RepID=UPI0013EDE03C|nr:DUF3990 domain-containing protein [Neisseria yangbaofengii]